MPPEGAALSSVRFRMKTQLFTPNCTEQAVGFDAAMNLTDMKVHMGMCETQICTEFSYRLRILNLRLLDTEFKYALEEEILWSVLPYLLINSQKHARLKLLLIMTVEVNCIL